MLSGDLRELISREESGELEFKSTLRFDIAERTMNRLLPKEVAKAIAGFLNNKGGMLLIGVGDHGGILGIEQDIPSPGERSLTDVFDRTLRQAVGKHLGVETSSQLDVDYVVVDQKTVAAIPCPRSEVPIYLTDGDKCSFYVRDGKATRTLSIKDAHDYIGRRFDSDPRYPSRDDPVPATHSSRQETLSSTSYTPGRNSLGQKLRQLFYPTAITRPPESESPVPERAVLARSTQPTAADTQRHPAWLSVHTRNVINAFLTSLKKSKSWRTIYIISPWLSSPSDSSAMSLEQLALRAEKYRATIYIVTRPPDAHWHQKAIDILTSTSRANVAFVPGLHAKLFTADVLDGSFALLGSANLTRKSEENLEIGLLVNSYQDGKKVIRALNREAAGIYRSPGRILSHRAHI